MTRVMAQGTFDILHPGHVHYLRESRNLGDELVVVIARDERLSDEKDLYFSDEERRSVVGSLDVVDYARRGMTGDPFEILDEVEPDIVTIGHDQPYDIDRLETEFQKRGYDDISIVRIGAYDPADDEIVSSSEIKARLKDRHGPSVFHSLKE